MLSLDGTQLRGGLLKKYSPEYSTFRPEQSTVNKINDFLYHVMFHQIEVSRPKSQLSKKRVLTLEEDLQEVRLHTVKSLVTLWVPVEVPPSQEVMYL